MKNSALKLQKDRVYVGTRVVHAGFPKEPRVTECMKSREKHYVETEYALGRNKADWQLQKWNFWMEDAVKTVSKVGKGAIELLCKNAADYNVMHDAIP